MSDHPALNQKALDSVECNGILPADIAVIDGKKNAFMKLIEAWREKLAAESRRYNRKEACLLIGFPGKTKSFTDWLRNNSFLELYDHPENSLIERGLMEVHQKDFYKPVKYDCCSQPVSGNEYDCAEIIKSVYVPLFTLKGISFFKALLADKMKLRQEIEKITFNKQSNYYQ